MQDRGRRFVHRLRRGLGLWALACVAPTAAFAQTAEDEGTFQADAADPSAAEEVEGTEINFEINAGFTATSGNSQSMALNGGALFDLREGSHGFRAEFTSVVGYAVGGDAESNRLFDQSNQNALNVIGRLRYDWFATDDDALFVAMWARHDPFAGLSFRYQGQAGYVRNFYRVEKHRFWGEVGYDVTVDWFDFDRLNDDDRPDNADDLVDQSPFDQHSARLFIGYTNRLNEALTFSTGFEVLTELSPEQTITPDDPTTPDVDEQVRIGGPENTRIFWENTLGSKIDDRFTLNVGFILIWDNQPVPGFESLDTKTLITLAYDLI